MKLKYYIITIIVLSNCSTRTEHKSNDITAIDTLIVDQKMDSDSAITKEWSKDDFVDCDFDYDTIANRKYIMHLSILEKFKDKTKRGYVFSSEGDTVNNFLYYQDITEFVTELDPAEQGTYKTLTNKVVFLILEQEPKMLDLGLTQWMGETKELDYFMKHVSHPFCHTLAIDSIINTIKVEMGEPHLGAKKVKNKILEKLEQSKR